MNFKSFLLLETILAEAKLIVDHRHPNMFKELPYWPVKEDPQYIDPADGFHWAYSEGQLNLFSTENNFYSTIASSPKMRELSDPESAKKYKDVRDFVIQNIKDRGKDLWNCLSGKVVFSTGIITISKDIVRDKKRIRVLYHVKEFQSALKNLMSYGVKEDFKIKGTAAPLNGKSVKEILEMEAPIDTLYSAKDLVMYHGTSKIRADKILKTGLRPGNTGDIYVDLIKGYSEHNVYLATDAKTAEFYGKRQAAKDDDLQYVIFKVAVPDKAKIKSDDAFIRSGENPQSTESAIKRGLKTNGSVAYNGAIKPQFLTVVGTHKARKN